MPRTTWPFSLAHGELDLVAVPPGILGVPYGPDEPVDIVGGEPADACECRAEILRFGGKLVFAPERTPGAAAAKPHEGAWGLDAVGGGFDDPLHMRARERRTLGVDRRLYDIAGHRARDEDGLSFRGAGDGIWSIGHSFDGQLHAAPFSLLGLPVYPKGPTCAKI